MKRLEAGAHLASIISCIVAVVAAVLAWVAVGAWRDEAIATRNADAAIEVLASLDAYERNIRAGRSRNGVSDEDLLIGNVAEMESRRQYFRQAVQDMESAWESLVILDLVENRSSELRHLAQARINDANHLISAINVLSLGLYTPANDQYKAELFSKGEADELGESITASVDALRLKLLPFVLVDE